MARYILIGAGAIGATLGAQLHLAGRSVVLVARGAHLAALREQGLRYFRPDGEHQIPLAAVGGPDELTLRPDDVLVLATKSQDSDATLAQWAWAPVTRADGSQGYAASELPLVSVQNGLDNERIALRRFQTVIGCEIWLPGTFDTPGQVVSPAEPTVALLWIGRYPNGTAPIVTTLAEDLRAAGCGVQEVEDIQAWKAAKLQSNLANVLDALYRPSSLREAAIRALVEEMRTIFAAAGLPIVDRPARSTLDTSQYVIRDVPGHPRAGSSTWQSLSRAGSLETDFLNGEVVLQARLIGRDAPLNAALQQRIARAAAAGTPAGSLDDDDLVRTLPTVRRPVLVDARSLRRELRSADGPVLLDVRWALGDPDGRAHYEDGHLPGAVFVDLDRELAGPPSGPQGRHPLPDPDQLQRDVRRWGLRAGQPVVVYDDNGGQAAARAWWLLRWAGVADVRILDGALGAWRAAGYDLEAGPGPEPAPGDVTVRPGQLQTLDADGAAALPTIGRLLDARAGERYRGEVEPIDSQAGHIPGAVSAPTADNLDSDGRFRLAEQLRQRFASLGVDPERPVGVYCGSGVSAAHELAALAIAGFDGVLFPGSWSAWSADSARPIATGTEAGHDVA